MTIQLSNDIRGRSVYSQTVQVRVLDLVLAWSLLLVASIPVCSGSPWIGVEAEPEAIVSAAQVFEQQPVLELWTEREQTDAFGNSIPSTLVSESIAPNTHVRAILQDLETDTSTPALMGVTDVLVVCGRAIFTDLIVQKVGRYRIMFGADFLSTSPTNRTRAFEVVPGAPYALAMTQHPNGFRLQRAFQQQPVLEVRDRGSNVVFDSTLTVSCEILPPTQGVAIWSDSSSLQAQGGVANFERVSCTFCIGSTQGLALSTVTASARLRFSATGIFAVDTDAFDVSSWPPDGLIVSQAPDVAYAGRPFAIQPIVYQIDNTGYLITWEPEPNSEISVQVLSRPGTIQSLTGKRNAEIKRGFSIFTDLQLDFANDAYALQFVYVSATFVDISVQLSPLFNVIFGTPAQLGIGKSFGAPSINGTQPAGGVPGYPLVKQPIVVVQDVAGNWVRNATLGITVQLLKDGEETEDRGLELTSGGFRSCPIVGTTYQCQQCDSVSADCGRFVFRGLRIDSAGSGFQLVFSSGLLKPATSQRMNIVTGPPFGLGIVRQPLGFRIDFPPRVQPQIQVLDEGNNLVETARVEIFPTLCTEDFAQFPALDVNATLCKVGNILTVEYLRAPATSVTNGVAIFTDLTISTVGQGFRLLFCASVEQIRCVNSSFFNVTFTPIQLTVSTQPSQVRAGAAFGQMPVVAVSDLQGVPAPWSPVGFLIVSSSACVLGGDNVTEVWLCDSAAQAHGGNELSCPPPDAPPELLEGVLPAVNLQGTLSQPAEEGVAVFTDLRIDRAGTFKMLFSSGGLKVAESEVFMVERGAGAQLKVLRHHQGTRPGFSFDVQPVVALQDSGGNLIETDSETVVTAALLVGAESVEPIPIYIHKQPAAIPVVKGLAWFQGLGVAMSGRSYQILYSATLWSGQQTNVSSDSFFLVPGAAARLILTRVPSRCSLLVSPPDISICQDQPVVSVGDKAGNVVATATVSVRGSVWVSLTAQEPLRVFFAEAVLGVATFSNFSSPIAGTGLVLRFESDGLEKAEVSDFIVSGVPGQLRLIGGGPGRGEAGFSLGNQPVVAVEDEAGRLVDADSSVAVTASVTDYPSCPFPCVVDENTDFLSGSNLLEQGQFVPVGGRNGILANGGFSTFSNLQINVRELCYVMVFSAAGLRPSASLPFSVVSGVHRVLVVTREPFGAVPGQELLVQPSIAVQDAGGNLRVEDSDTVVTASLLGRSLSDLQGGFNKVIQVTEGQGSFSGLRIDVASSCLLMEFSAVGRNPGYSQTFEVFPLEPVRLSLLPGSEPGGPVPGQALASQPALVVEDLYGNRGNPRAGDLWVDVILLQGGKEPDCEIEKVCLYGNLKATFERAGIATFTDLRIDKMNTGAANYSLRFSSDGLLPVESARDLLVETSPIVVGLGIIVPPDGFAAGQRFLTTPVVGIVDAGGNVVADSFATTVSLELEGGEEGGSGLGGTSIVLSENGIARFDDLLLNSSKANLTLYFSAFAVGLGFIRTESFDVADPTAVLRVLVQPIGAEAGLPFPFQPIVEARDAGGRLVTAVGAVSNICIQCVAVELVSDNAVLQGNRTAIYVRGSAIFTDFRIDIAGTYILRFKANNNVSVLSNPVHIKNKDPATLVLVQEPLPLEAGSELGQQPILRLLDAFGNLVLDRSVLVTAQLYKEDDLCSPAGCSAPIMGNNVVPSRQAVANFNASALGVVDAGRDFFFVFSTALTTSVSSALFRVPTAAPYRMRFLDTPANFYEGEVLTPFPVLHLEDKGGNVVSSNQTVSVTLYDMTGCRNASQNDQSFAIDSMLTPCGEQVAGLGITQPWCVAEQVRDDASLYCAAILDANATTGSLPLIPLAGSWPLHPSQRGYSVDWRLQSTINITLAEVQKVQVPVFTTNATVTWEAFNYSLFEITYNATFETNETEVFTTCVGRANLSMTVNVSTRGYTQQELREAFGVNFTSELFLFPLGQESNVSAAKNTTLFSEFTQSGIISHTCTKYNLSESLSAGEVVFRGLTVLQPGSAMKLRFTLYDCPLILGGVDPSCASQMSMDDAMIVETSTFDVSGFPTRLQVLSWPSQTSTGGSPFLAQPSFRITDSAGRPFTKRSRITVSATLLANDGLSGCNLGTPYRCPSPAAVCVIRPSQCPELLGVTQRAQQLGHVEFTDLAITTCNDFTVESFICVFGEYRISFLAAGVIEFPNTTNVSISLQIQTSPTISIDLGPPAQLLISIEPLAGNARAGQALTFQPSLYMLDAGGNRALDAGIQVRVSALNNETNVTASALDGRLAIPSWKGASTFTDLAILLADTPLELHFSTDSGARVQAQNSLQVLPAMAVSIVIDKEPSIAIGGEPFEVQPIVSIRDAWGNLAWMEQQNISADLAPWSRHQGGALCQTQCNPEEEQQIVLETKLGVASFVGVAIDTVASCYVILFSSPSLFSATSAPLSVDSGPPFQLIILQEPDGALPGYALSTQPTVGVCDRGRNQVPFNRDRVVASSSLAGQSLPLDGRRLQRAVDGYVRFTDLTLLESKNGTVLTFTRFVGGMVPVNSQPLIVPPGVSHSLRVVHEATTPRVGNAFREQPVVHVEDAGGNLVVDQKEVLVTAQLLQNEIPSRLPLHGPSCTSIDCVLPCFPPLPCPTASLRCPSCLPLELRGFTLPTNGSDSQYRQIREAVDPSGLVILQTVQGIANFSFLGLETVGTDFHIRFTSFPLRWADSIFRLEVSAGAPWKLGFARRPTGFQANTPFREQPVLQVQDVGSNRMYVTGGAIVATLWGLGESGDVNGTRLLPERNLVVTVVSGEARFVDLRVDTAGPGVSILFTSTICYAFHSRTDDSTHTTDTRNSSNSSKISPTVQTELSDEEKLRMLSRWYKISPGCLPAYTGHFTVTEPPTTMSVKRGPTTSVIQHPLVSQPIIVVLDDRGRLVDYESGRRVVQVSLVADASREPAVLGGTRRVVCCGGVCPFTDLTVDRGQAGYRLLFSSPPFADVFSGLFDVVGPSRLTMSQQPWGGLVGRPFAVQPRVIITDEWGGKIEVNVTVTATLGGGSEASGTQLLGTVAVNSTLGEAVFTDLHVDGIGSRFVLRFASDTLLGTVSEELEVDGTVRPNACAADQTCRVGT